MKSPDYLRVLLQVRFRAEEIEERRLIAINERLRVAHAELARLSAELERITDTRIRSIQSTSPNVYHQAVEAQSKALWRRDAEYRVEIEGLKKVQAQQMVAYLTAHREREVMESLRKQRCEALERKGRLNEQKLNEELFLARSVAK